MNVVCYNFHGASWVKKHVRLWVTREDDKHEEFTRMENMYANKCTYKRTV